MLVKALFKVAWHSLLTSFVPPPFFEFFPVMPEDFLNLLNGWARLKLFGYALLSEEIEVPQNERFEVFCRRIRLRAIFN